MSSKDNIVYDKNRLERFKITLTGEYSRLKKAKSFSAIKDLETIIDEVSRLNDALKLKLIEANLIRNKTKINKNLNCFYDKFFNLFDDKSEIFDELLLKSECYFFARKIHQLSHAHGEYEENISKQEKIADEIKNYYLFLLFVDYYETFPVFFKPLIQIIWEKGQGYYSRPINFTIEWYEKLIQIVPDLVISLNKMYYFRELRNKIAHSNILFLPDCLLINKEGKIEKDSTIDKVKEDIHIFQNNVKIFATEFDLRMLQLGIEGEDDYFDNWFKYFKLYNGDWQRIGPSIKK